MPLKESDYAKAIFLFLVGSVALSIVAIALMGVLAGVTFHAGGWRLASVNIGAIVMGAISSLLITYGIFRATVVRYIVKRLTRPSADRGNVGAV